jgi:hypothetical protein
LFVSTGSKLGARPMALSDAIIATYMTIHMVRSPRFVGPTRVSAAGVKELGPAAAMRTEIHWVWPFGH